MGKNMEQTWPRILKCNLTALELGKGLKVYNTICGNKITHRRVAEVEFVKHAHLMQKWRHSYVVTLLYHGEHRVSLYPLSTLPQTFNVR
jgi:hypothetical protein